MNQQAFELGKSAYDQGDWFVAISQFDVAKEPGEVNGQIDHLLGNAYMKLGQFDSAASAYKSALADRLPTARLALSLLIRVAHFWLLVGYRRQLLPLLTLSRTPLMQLLIRHSSLLVLHTRRSVIFATPALLTETLQLTRRTLILHQHFAALAHALWV